MKNVIKSAIIILLLSISHIIFAERQISGSVIATTPYIPGTTTQVEFELQFTSPDFEYVIMTELTLPNGFTPAGTPSDIGALQFNSISNQTISWGATDQSLGVLIGDSSPFVFSIDVAIASNLNGEQPFQYLCIGDDFGAEPHAFSGTSNIVQALNYDLVASEIFGNAVVTAQTQETFQIKIINQGTNDINNYTVEVFINGSVSIGTINENYLTSGTEELVDFHWTPVSTGSIELTAVIIYASDQNTSNNETPGFQVEILPAGFEIIDVGDGTQSLNIVPINYWFRNSLIEQMYFPEELQTTGSISEIAFYYDFIQNPSTSVVNIWIGETTLPNLNEGFIPSGQLDQIYSGSIDYSIGEGTAHIQFTSPYNYEGGNLVLLIERVMETDTYSSNNNFYYTNDDGSHPARSRARFSDDIDFDPSVSYTEGNPLSMFANTSFFFSTEPGSISGTVTDGSNPLPNAIISIDNTGITTITDTDGNYIIQDVYSGTISLTASLDGFEDSYVSDITINANQNTAVDVIMTPITEILAPPTSLTLETSGVNSIELNWSPPANDIRSLIGYKIYRNSVILTEVEETITAYSDTNLENIHYTYFTTAIYTLGESESSNSVSVNLTSATDTDLIITNKLIGNNPNPFNPSTTISFSVISSSSFVKIDIYNIKGQHVKRLLNKQLHSGNHSVLWNGNDSNGNSVSSGIYFYKLQNEGFISTKKMTLSK
ncbi:MAG: hypothetical protein B6226_00245 [Candidatus Cloacimonetes bacterium 4572_65]|nr:MAG: hypothetical protein B6226_00245 [Candidatus Cloacimonetes bacterium 4572_65]